MNHSKDMTLGCPVELSDIQFTTPSEEILHVSATGEFTWHKDAERLIEEGDYSNSPSLQFILRRLWKYEAT
jgi:hypothetical protein